MIEYCKITGERDGDDIEVMFLLGTTAFCSMATLNGDIPSTDWVISNKDNMMAMVSYEGESLCEPMIVGFIPLIGKKTSDLDSVTINLLKQVCDLAQQVSDLADSLSKITILDSNGGPCSINPPFPINVSEIKTSVDNIKDYISNLNKKIR